MTICDIKNMASLSAKIGKRVDYVQGGGGNASVKIQEGIMAIKASGYLLRNVTETDGLAFVDYDKINKMAVKGNFNPIGYEVKREDIPMLRPSIETGFHALLPQKYVLHTHSVYTNIVCCSVEGKRILGDIYPLAVWCDYANPGEQITRRISEILQKGRPQVIFMQNHGLIVCGDSAEECLDLQEEVNNRVISHFGLPLLQECNPVLNSDDAVIFPDQVVYLEERDYTATAAGRETMLAYSYIIGQITGLKLTVNTISKEDVDFIKNMESEKYRKSLVQ